MPSQPSRPQSTIPTSQQRPPSPSAQSSASLQRQRRGSYSKSASEDPQAVSLSGFFQSPAKVDQQQSQASSSSSGSEPRKCWICLSDETEDTPTSSAWRSPCPCALRAHEACLLDWVADLEAPNRKKSQGLKSKIQCPQCTHEIAIARPPRGFIVTSVNALETAAERLVYPIILVGLAGSIISGCWLHGYSTVYVLFGAEEAERILRYDTRLGFSGNIVLGGLGPPLIPIILVLSRTTFADSLLPFLPILLLSFNLPTRPTFTLWPPSTAVMLAALPYVRAVYNEFYGRILAPREQAWLKEIQPRAGEPGEGGANANGAAGENEGNGLLNLEIALAVDIFPEEDAIPRLPENPAPIAQVQDQLAQQHQQQQPPAGAAAVPAAPRQRQPDLVVNALDVIDTVVGALFFPTISASMGALLSLCLPRSWTAKPSGLWPRPVGLLQGRFGRSLVGGVLFVVLKDAVGLYSKYRLAREHSERRIVDWKGREGSREQTQ